MGRILVTGATGFVGRHLVPHLLSSGRDLTLAVRTADACPRSWREAPRIRIVVTGPLETADNLAETLRDVSTVVHLAGLAHVRHGSGADAPFVAANVTATEKLTKAAADHGVGAFIHMSSLAAITQNTSPTIIDDATLNGASTPYGRSKYEAEKLVSALTDKNVFVISLRPPLVVGADAVGNWRALQRLAATGAPLPFATVGNRRSLIGIDTLVRALAHLSTGRWSPDKSGNYCIADKETMSLPHIVAQLRKGMRLPVRQFSFPPAILHTLARLMGRRQMAAGLLGDLEIDASRFQGAFGFSQNKSLADSIAESGAQYRRHIRA